MSATIGIDAATTTGLAIIDGDDVRTLSVRIPLADITRRVDTLRTLIGTAAIGSVAIEQPYTGRHASAGLTVAKHVAMWEAAAHTLRLRVVRMTPSEWRRHTIPGVVGREKCKLAQRKWALRVYGVDVTEDEADALGLAYAAARTAQPLTLDDVHARITAAGVPMTLPQLRDAVRDGRFPSPDVATSKRSRWWHAATVDGWVAAVTVSAP